MTTAQTLLTIAVIAAGTMLTRFAPFLLLRLPVRLTGGRCFGRCFFFLLVGKLPAHLFHHAVHRVGHAVHHAVDRLLAQVRPRKAVAAAQEQTDDQQGH